jgi:hypothetical protein
MKTTKCVQCGKFMGLNIGLGHFNNGGENRKTRDGKWACTDLCARDYNMALSLGGNSSDSGNPTTFINKKSNAEVEAMRDENFYAAKAAKDQRIESRVDSISMISFGADILQVQDVLNQLATIGASKPDINVRKAIVEKMEFGIMRLKGEGLLTEAKYFEEKMKKIKPSWFDYLNQTSI